MKKTKVDDFLIEMIRPKIEEIEKKFNNNEALSQDDINTLLLKSQYNHINHLDEKLNETVDTVKNLEFRFEKLEVRFNHLEDKFINLEKKFVKLEDKLTNDMQNLEKKLTNDMKNLEEKLTNDMKNLEEKIAKDMKSLEEKLTNDMKNLEEKLTKDMKNLEEKLSNNIKNLEDKFTKKMEATIQQALNKNMLLLITILGTFFTIIKVSEILAKG